VLVGRVEDAFCGVFVIVLHSLEMTANSIEKKTPH